VPLIGNTTAQPVSDVAAIRAELADQLTGSVRWYASMNYLLNQGVTRFVEIGAGSVLTGLMKRINRKSTRLSVEDPDGVEALATLLAE
jgi:[acyl-carrier-protein] S-malonyltransferase